jgi:hypothetical protein
MRVKGPSRLKAQAIGLVAALAACAALGGTMAHGQSDDENLRRLDRLAARGHALEAAPGFDRARLASVGRNLAAFADRWSAARLPIAAAGVPGGSFAAGATVKSHAPSKMASMPTLGLSRYAGFTQSQTSTAWCGANVLTAFNDTGSEIRTLGASAGLSVIGLAASSNRGGTFSYMGTPAVGAGFYQTLLGAPVVACADDATFFYAAIWSDTQAEVSGVAFAKSTDAGVSFSTPAVVVSKNSLTDFVDHDWLAIDPNNHSAMYIAYADLDFSGTFCGTDPASRTNIPRYAIELLASSDGGATWSVAPTVIEQVCANSANPSAVVVGPQVAVGPQGQVYVAYEAAGENGSAAAARQIKIAKSSDGGATFGSPVVVAAVTPVGDGADLQGFGRGNEFPSLAIGKGAKNGGVVYLAWNDGALSISDTLSPTAIYDFADIEFSASNDGGATWSAPGRVNDNPKSAAGALNDQFEPAIGADQEGDLAVCFYDRRRDPNNFRIDRECAKSTNGGATWNNRKITKNNFAATVGQDLFVAPDYMGDYDTVVADSTNKTTGFIDSYADSSAGNPNVMCHKE